jgi:hypothetical protein
MNLPFNAFLVPTSGGPRGECLRTDLLALRLCFEASMAGSGPSKLFHHKQSTSTFGPQEKTWQQPSDCACQFIEIDRAVNIARQLGFSVERTNAIDA